MADEPVITALQKLAHGQLISPAEAAAYILDTPRTASTIFRGDQGFKRSQTFMELLGNPQDAVPTIHIAGTSGKGSITAVLTSLLAAHGFATGSYISPHVYELRERWRLNNVPINGETLAEAVMALYPAAQKMAASEYGAPTYFETTTTIGFLAAKAKHVKYSVIETGMGGLYDTTNTITRSDKLAVIGQLGLDHMHILGETLAEIAYQKAGILPAGGSAIVLEPNNASARQAILQVASQKNVALDFVTTEFGTVHSVSTTGTLFDYHSPTLELANLELGLIGEHQARNCSLALRALEFLAQRDGFAINEAAVRSALKNTRLPGRLEQRTVYGVPAIFDGAHNPQKIGALVATLQKIYPGKTFTWLLAFGAHKDIAQSLKLIAPLADRVYTTGFFAGQDMPLSSKATNPNALAELATHAGIKQVFVEPDNQTALKKAAKHAGNMPFIAAGSFYLLGELGAE